MAGRCDWVSCVPISFNCLVLDAGSSLADGCSLLRLRITNKMARTASAASTTAPTVTPAIPPDDNSFDGLADEVVAGGVEDAVADVVVGTIVEISVDCAVVEVEVLVC